MINLNGKFYKELRCHKCQKFILYHNIEKGNAAYQCPRCAFLNEFTFMKYTKEAIEFMKSKFKPKGGEKDNGRRD